MNQAVEALRQLVTWLFRIGMEGWIWTISQFGRLANLNWWALPWWKQVGLVLVAAGAGYCVYQVYKPVWESLTRLVGAFASFVSVMITSLPWIILAGIVVVVGLKVLNL